MAFNLAAVIFKCDFNDADKTTACNGSFNHSVKNQIVDVFETSNTANTELKYDVTDYTSSICFIIYSFLYNFINIVLILKLKTIHNVIFHFILTQI